jgi:hypothetical protein
MFNTYAAKVGDQILVTLPSGNTHPMTIIRIYSEGSGGRAYCGPIIHAWIRPGGYGVTFDARDIGGPSVKAVTAA